MGKTKGELRSGSLLYQILIFGINRHDSKEFHILNGKNSNC